MEKTDLLREMYDRFNARDLDAILGMLNPDVKWPNGWEGGHVVGHAALRAYWTRQWAAINPTVVPQGFEVEPDGRIRVAVRQRVVDACGKLLSERTVAHTYSFDGDKIKVMEISELS